MALSRKVVLPPVGAATAAVTVAAAAYALVVSLPQPTASDRTGVRVLRFLETKRGAGSEISVGGKTLTARCIRVSRRGNLVSLSDGNRFMLVGSHIRAWRTPDRSLAAVESDPLLHAAEADLAGSYSLYIDELTAELENGHRVLGGATLFGGRPAYAVHLSADRPRATLFVDRGTLAPLGASFESAGLHGRAVLQPPASAHSEAGC
jgi:hypothetical protein